MRAFTKIFAAFFLLLAQPCAAAPSGAGRVVANGDVILYPAGWKVIGENIITGIEIYYKDRHPHWEMPGEEADWASISVRRYLYKDEDGQRATVADYVADKNCAVNKCNCREHTCPVHSKGLQPPNRLSKACPATTTLPILQGGYFCGRYYKRENSGGTYYYYFDHFEPKRDDEKAAYAEITVIFARKNFIYVVDLSSSAGRIKNYLKHLEFVARNTGPLKR